MKCCRRWNKRAESASLLLASCKELSSKQRQEKAVLLARLLLELSQSLATRKEKRRMHLMHRMVQDPLGKTLITAFIDSAFRTKSPKRTIAHLQALIQRYGAPQFLAPLERALFLLFAKAGHFFPRVATALLKWMIRKETHEVILPGEEKALQKHLRKRAKSHISINLNRLGEAVLGQHEVERRIALATQDLSHPDVEMISIKISTLYSQISPFAHLETVEALKEPLRKILRSNPSKCVNLDMEEYRDLRLTYDLFHTVLDEDEFLHITAGMALQSYIPDSFEIQKELTAWASERCKRGGAPLRIRIVKGANLGMEKVEASLKNWPQAPYHKKVAADANFKRMVHFALQHTDSVHVGIASHNIFDLAYGLVLRAEYKKEKEVRFEMLEGMANYLAKALQMVAKDLLLYCPVASNEEFHTAIAYLMRRLDEQTAKENFLPHFFEMTEASFEREKQQFLASCEYTAPSSPQRTQNRQELYFPAENTSFSNEPDTDWSLPQNQSWAKKIVAEWQQKTLPPITQKKISHLQPLTASECSERFKKAAVLLRKERAALIGCMMKEVHKPLTEADAEVSEAIDMCEYYARHIARRDSQGTAVVITPWNFPCAIPTSGILAALAAGYSVIFKPAPEAVQTGFLLSSLLQDAGLPLSTIAIPDEPEGSALVKDPRVKAIILTGSTLTARYFQSLRPDVALFAETGGKNSMIVTSLADRDLAVKDTIQSAFSYAGQKCSALSLLICEDEVYDDPLFRAQLIDAAASLYVGSTFDVRTKINRLIAKPSPHLLRGLTTLDEGEEWWLQPKQLSSDGTLWSPGIKAGVQSGSFTHQTELFGPVLGVMRASSLKEAISFANDTPYGLTAGLHSLDTQEHDFWLQHIQAGNLYINRSITGAIVGRQPFGGTKCSSFGPGMKAGGPRYITQMMQNPTQTFSFTDPKIVGEENRLFFVPHEQLFVFQQPGDDLSQLIEKAKECKAQLHIYSEKEALIKAIIHAHNPRLIALQPLSQEILDLVKDKVSVVLYSELQQSHFMREVSLSYSYHRYGSLYAS